jgi:RNA polymerase sigma-70 factor (ECF subfamily)
MNTERGGGSASDAELLARVRGGDHQALGILYDRYGGTMYSLARAITTREAVAESVVAEAFAQLCQNASSLQASRESVLTWLTASVRQQAWAKRPGRKAGIEAKVLHDARVETSTMDEGMSSQSAAVLDVLARLGEEERKAVELAYFFGLTPRQIAVELGEPVPEVGRYLRGGMDSIRHALSRDAAPAVPYPADHS